MELRVNMNYPDPDFLLKAPLRELIFLANKVRKNYSVSSLELCNIINAKSGSCSQDCKFCAQSSQNSAKVITYTLKSKKEIVTAAGRAKKIGAEKFGIVTSGNSLSSKELDILISAVSEIKNKITITVCASLGALAKNQLEKLKEAGLSRYHHNIETSQNFYPQIVSTHSFKERVNTIKAAKEVGLEVCSGGIIGMGEGWQDRIDMALFLRDLDVDSVPINFLVPIKGTPLEANKPVSRKDALRTICIFRIILKNKIIKIAAGREMVLKGFQTRGFMAGANGMLIGGYLTIKGRKLQEDYQLIKKIEKAWKE